MAKSVPGTKNTFGKASLSFKALGVIALISLGVAMLAIYLANNVPQVEKVTGKQSMPWYQAFNPFSWFN